MVGSPIVLEKILNSLLPTDQSSAELNFIGIQSMQSRHVHSQAYNSFCLDSTLGSAVNDCSSNCRFSGVFFG